MKQNLQIDFLNPIGEDRKMKIANRTVFVKCLAGFFGMWTIRSLMMMFQFHHRREQENKNQKKRNISCVAAIHFYLRINIDRLFRDKSSRSLLLNNFPKMQLRPIYQLTNNRH